MSLLSGTTANMPTPEIVNATWGGAGFGLIFFATDTGIMWQWNGAAWVNVTSSFFVPPVNRNIFTGGAVVLPADALVHTIYTGVVAAGILGSNGGFKCEAYFLSNLTGGLTIQASFGGTPCALWAISASGSSWINFSLLNTAVAVQASNGIGFFGGAFSPSNSYTPAINTALAQTLTLTAQKAVAGDSVAFQQGFATLL